MFLVLGQSNKVHLQLSGLAQPAAEISWFVSRICRLANMGAKWCRMQNETNLQRSALLFPHPQVCSR